MKQTIIILFVFLTVFSYSQNGAKSILSLYFQEQGAVELGDGVIFTFYSFIDEEGNEYQFRKPNNEQSLKILNDVSNYGKWLTLTLTTNDIETAEILKVELPVTLNLEVSVRIKNIADKKISVLDIDELHKLKAGHYYIKVVISGNRGATDFGTYRNVYLIFDNGYEMPNRNAVFEIGRISYLNSTMMISESEIVLDCVGYEQEFKGEGDINVSKVTIDISDVLMKEKLLDETSDDFEGSIESYVSLRVSEE